MYVEQDVGAMIEARNAREWEELNTFIEPDFEEIDLDMGDALDNLTEACKALADAAKELEYHPYEYRVRSLFSDLESIQDDITSLRARLKEVKSA